LAISKERKREIVADYAEKMSSSQAMILADYRGLSVADLSELRVGLREVEGVFQVVKNTLFDRALQDAGIPVPWGHLEGPIAVGYCFDEVPPVAKALTEFAKEQASLKIHGAILGQEFLDAEGVKSLADLPAREVLLAQLVGAVQGPMSNLVTTITAPMRELVHVLQARSEQNQEAAA
jgi:large subunit ribosomal protein L10